MLNSPHQPRALFIRGINADLGVSSTTTGVSTRMNLIVANASFASDPLMANLVAVPLVCGVYFWGGLLGLCSGFMRMSSMLICFMSSLYLFDYAFFCHLFIHYEYHNKAIC